MICTALLMPVAAHADPVTAFFVGIAGVGGTTAAVAAALAPTAFAIGAFFTSTLGTIILNVGLSALLTSKARAPSIADARVNTRLSDAPRWQLGGTVATGGEVGIFAEYDDDGNFWFAVCHGDAELIGNAKYILDGIEVEISRVGEVTELPAVTKVFSTNIALSGETGGTLESRVLVRGQTNPVENGIYITSDDDWTRASDMADGASVGVIEVVGPPEFLTPRSWRSIAPCVVGTDPNSWIVASDIEDGDVITEEFCLNKDNNQYGGDGSEPRKPNFRIFTVTPSVGSIYGALPAQFTAAFPDLPSDFYLAGVCYSIIRCRSVALQDYSKAMRWRGALGLGEPAVSIVGNFNRMYDPRNVAHDINDPDTWTASDGNPAIIWAWWRTNAIGRARPMSEIAWDLVAAQADICDQTVLDRTGTAIPRYRCGVAFPDNKPRHECEADILLTCDGFVAYDDEGRAWPRVGIYEAPTLSFTAARDILSAQTQIIDDGETAVDGVIVNYIEPTLGYTKQPAAPWKNPIYYDGTSEPNYLSVDVLGCYNHNQAVRIGKAIGLRSASVKRAALQTTIKGVLAKGVRTIDLDYDANFSGDFEIVTPVQEGAGGVDASFAVVPMQTDRYDLAEGEEGAPPSLSPSLNIDNDVGAATGVLVVAESVLTSGGGAGVRLRATFDAPARVDRFYRFRYAVTGSEVYEYFTVNMDDLFAYSAVVDDGQDYDVQWQTATAGGRATDWSAILTVTATANPTPPAALVSASATGGIGEVVTDFTTANDTNQFAVQIYAGTTTVLGDALLVATVIAGANVTQDVTYSGLTAGTYYLWAIPLNGSGIAGTTTGPMSATVS